MLAETIGIGYSMLTSQITSWCDIVFFRMKATVTATDFKATCLSLLSDMEQHGEPITITRRGIPVAVLSPVPKNAWKSPADSWKGKAEIVGDIVNTDDDILWEAIAAK